jgi:hypothetical protein
VLDSFAISGEGLPERVTSTTSWCDTQGIGRSNSHIRPVCVLDRLRPYMPSLHVLLSQARLQH